MYITTETRLQVEVKKSRFKTRIFVSSLEIFQSFLLRNTVKEKAQNICYCVGRNLRRRGRQSYSKTKGAAECKQIFPRKEETFVTRNKNNKLKLSELLDRIHP